LASTARASLASPARILPPSRSVCLITTPLSMLELTLC
jgi:hypothetical protein